MLEKFLNLLLCVSVVSMILFIIIAIAGSATCPYICKGEIYKRSEYNAATRTYQTTQICVKNNVVIGFEKRETK